ncbi:DUF1573 domain-containing protein [Candidatus Sumerlaeota bacterium]|nr:DUF1573 domain-containing protein [Candidatus Sumerlaeota bacterium]
MRILSLLVLFSSFCAVSLDAYGGPKIMVESEEVDFGTVCLHGICEKSLIIQNVGDSPLSLKIGQYSCASCSRTELDDKILSPGQSTKLHIEFRPSQLGAASGFVTVENNSPEQPKKAIKLKATGVDYPVVKPHAIDLGLLVVGEWKELGFSLLSKEPIDILDVNARKNLQLDEESLQIQSVPEGKQVKVLARLEDDRSAREGDTIEVRTSLETTPRLWIPVAFKSVKPVECVPSSIYIMKEESLAGNWVKKGSLISHSGTLDLTEITVSSPDVQVKVESSSEKEIDFSVRPSSSFTDGFKEITITFSFNQGSGPLSVTCRVVVVDI